VTGIRTKIEGNRIYLLGVQLAALSAKARQPVHSRH